MAYVASKISYIFGKNCTNKFLQKAPDSEISEQIRKNRAEDKRRWWTDHDDQLQKFSEIIDKIDCCCQLSDVEAQILDDCNSTAFWKFSLPLQVASAGAVYLAIGRGLLGSSSWSSAFPRAPKMIVGAAAGQYLYFYSKDCSNRFLQYAPSGRIARELRGDTTFLAEVNSDTEEGAEDLDSEYSDYIIPEYGADSVNRSIKDNCEL